MSNNKSGFKRSSKEVKNYHVLIKTASLLAVSLTVLVAMVYFVSFLYDQYGSFTVSIGKYDMVKQGLTLSETGDFDSPVAKLNAKSVKEITNISDNAISADVDNINGSHNGDNYIAYTFYLKNAGEDTITYDYSVNIQSVSNDVDSAIRFRLYKNGEAVTYAKTRSDGTGAEDDTSEFLAGDTVVKQKVKKFAKGNVDKYTAVIWLEGNDPDCVDKIIGGKIKLNMTFSVSEN